MTQRSFQRTFVWNHFYANMFAEKSLNDEEFPINNLPFLMVPESCMEEVGEKGKVSASCNYGVLLKCPSTLCRPPAGTDDLKFITPCGHHRASENARWTLEGGWRAEGPTRRTPAWRDEGNRARRERRTKCLLSELNSRGKRATSRAIKRM
jgi:hypothetical protein